MKKFIPVFCLLLIALGFCVAGDAITVPPWWMIGQSATDNGSATFTVNISTTGNIAAATASTTGNATVGGTLGVTGKATVGTLESGAATFTGNIGMDKASMQVTNSRTTVGASIGLNARSYVWLGANLNGLGGKLVDASPSAVLEMYAPYDYPRLYTSAGGSSDPYQNGPYAVWHGGMTSFINSAISGSIVYGTSGTDGADATDVTFCGSGGSISSTRGAYLRLYGNETSSSGGAVTLSAGNVASGNIQLVTGGANRLQVTYGGDVRLNGLSGGGTTGASIDNDGDLIRTPSDLRLKEDITDITAGLDKVRAMRGVTFNWKDKQSYGFRRDYGMIAQEVEAVIPEVVTQNPDGMKSLDYQKIVPVLVEAIKDQQRIIESLESRINALEGK